MEIWHVLGSTIHGLHGSGLCHRWRVETWCLTSYLWIYPSHSLGNPEKWIGVWLMWTLVIPQYQGAYTVGKIAEDLQDDSRRNIGLNNSPVQSKWHNSDLKFASGHYLGKYWVWESLMNCLQLWTMWFQLCFISWFSILQIKSKYFYSLFPCSSVSLAGLTYFQ